MDINQLRELLLTRLYIELQVFKDSVLCMDKEAVFGEAYKIETFVNLYEILAERTGQLAEASLRELLYLGCGILEWLYREWLKKDDGSFNELKEYVYGALEECPACMEGGKAYGEEHSTAA